MKVNTFRTEISCPPSHPIGLKDSILTVGSCFADQFGLWLLNNKFNVLVNPFGTTYNPISIHKNILGSIATALDSRLFIEHHGLWHHLDYHSKWSAPSKDDFSKSIKKEQQRVKDYFQKVDVLVITYGTAWVYHHIGLDSLVSNCHKLPGGDFEKRLLSVGEITQSFDTVYSEVKKIQPGLQIILTVSPVRHIKDTLALNSVSKATLRLACHALSNHYAQVEYFPSYEIMMDDLRDYRFYDRDKIHPSGEAVEYISHKFSDQYFDQDTKSFIEKWNTIRQAMEHRPYHPHSLAHQHFLKELLHKLEDMKGMIPVVEEIEKIQSQIHSQ